MINYTPENLLSELSAQGVLIAPTGAGNLFLDGELSDAQISAVRELKPQIIDLLKSKARHFGTNENLFFDLEKAFQIFSCENKAANLFFLELLRYTERHAGNDEKEICFSQPSKSAYKACLDLASAIEPHGNLQTAFDDFLESHTLGVSLGEWVQDLPLWQTEIFDDGEMIGYAVGNSVQTAILVNFSMAQNPNLTYTVKRL